MLGHEICPLTVAVNYSLNSNNNEMARLTTGVPGHCCRHSTPGARSCTSALHTLQLAMPTAERAECPAATPGYKGKELVLRAGTSTQGWHFNSGLILALSADPEGSAGFGSSAGPAT